MPSRGHSACNNSVKGVSTYQPRKTLRNGRKELQRHEKQLNESCFHAMMFLLFLAMAGVFCGCMHMLFYREAMADPSRYMFHSR